jgi:uncharacterized protein (TIGR01244 family)
MTQFRTVTDRLSVSPQIGLDDVDAAADQGFKLIINNRPDGEDPAQPSGYEIEAAATAAGLGYAHVPVRGGPTPEQAETVRKLMLDVPGPTLAFCRSGTRSIVTWALGELMAGNRTRDELIALGRQAGYDLSAALPA